MPLKGHWGASLGGRIELSPKARKRANKRRKAQEKAWRAKNGPVRAYRLDPSDPRVRKP
jgi:hypothetical protein